MPEAARARLGPLEALRQVADVLVLPKERLEEPAFRRDVCPALGAVQLRRLLASYQPDDFDAEPVPASTLDALAAGPDEDDGSSPLFLDEAFPASEGWRLPPPSAELPSDLASRPDEPTPLPAPLRALPALSFLAADGSSPSPSPSSSSSSSPHPSPSPAEHVNE